jgi:HEAT repeat protein
MSGLLGWTSEATEKEVAPVGIFGPNIEKLKAKSDIEGLIKALTDKDESVRKAAAEALGDLGGHRAAAEAAVKPLATALRDQANSVGIAAAEALGKLGGSKACYELILAPRSIRVHALRSLASLARFGDTSATKELVRALRDADPAAQAAAAQALDELGTNAAETLVAAVADREIDAEVAAAMLGQMGGPTIGSLVGALHDDRHWARVNVTDTLCAIGNPALEPLIAALRDETSGIRELSAEALGKMGDPRAFEPLVVGLADGELRTAAVSALGVLGDPRAVGPLVTLLGDDDRWVRNAVAKALGKIGDPRGVEPLVAALGDRDKYVRGAAAEALNQMGWAPKDDAQRGLWLVSREEWSAAVTLGFPAIEPLVVALGDSEVRKAAAQALEEMGWKPRDVGQRALQLVIELENAEHGRRDGLVRALVQIGPRATEPLVAALKNDNREVRKAAAQALGEIGDPRAIEPLMSLATDEKRAIQEGVAPLATLLERVAPQVPEEVLQVIGSTRFWEWGVTWEPPEDMDPRCQLTRDWGVISADSSRVVQLARQELIRRGLEA